MNKFTLEWTERELGVLYFPIKFRNKVIPAVLAVAVLSLLGCSPERTYSAESVDSTVIDADTGKSVEGAVVLAYWELHQGSITGDSLPCGAANIEEAVTNKDGHFHIPGWGPVKGKCGIMRGYNPQLYVFKQGYKVAYASNLSSSPTSAPSVSRSEWNHKSIKLERFKNSDLTSDEVKSPAVDFQSFNDDIGVFIVGMPGQCNWKKIPMMLKAIIRQQETFNSIGNHHVSSVTLIMSREGQDKMMQKDAPQCGSPKAYIEALEKGLKNE